MIKIYFSIVFCVYVSSFYFLDPKVYFFEYFKIAIAAENSDNESEDDSSDPTLNHDCTGGTCGGFYDPCMIDPRDPQCVGAGTSSQCSTANTPTFTSSLSVSAQVGQAFSYALSVSPLTPSAASPERGWENPQMRARESWETGWFGSNQTSIDPLGLQGSGLSVSGYNISGAPAASGTYSVTLRSLNDIKKWEYMQAQVGGESGVQSAQEILCSKADILSINVSACASTPPGPPVISSAGEVEATVGAPVSYQVSASNYTSISASGTLPPGLSFTSPLSISGTPSNPGTYQLTIYAENGNPACAISSASKVVTFNIAPTSACANVTPTITSATSVSGEIGGIFSGYTIQTSRPADSYSLTSLEGMPPLLAVVNGGRSLEGSISSTQPRNQYRFEAEARASANGVPCRDRREVTLSLTCPASRPSFDPNTGQCVALQVCPSGQTGVYPNCTSVCTTCGGSGGGISGVCADPSAQNFGQTGTCVARSSCGAGETGAYPNCTEIPCPTCGIQKVCRVCSARDSLGNCTAYDNNNYPSESAQNSCGLTRTLYYCREENRNPPPPPGEQVCAQPGIVAVPDRELVQRGGQCAISWRFSPLPSEQAPSVRCVASGPAGFSARLNVSVNSSQSTYGSILTPETYTQSAYRLICRNGLARVSELSNFTCRVNPKFEER